MPLLLPPKLCSWTFWKHHTFENRNKVSGVLVNISSLLLSWCALMLLPSVLQSQLLTVKCSWIPADSGTQSIKTFRAVTTKDMIPSASQLTTLGTCYESVETTTNLSSSISIEKGLRRQQVEWTVLVDKDRTTAYNYRDAKLLCW